jgi:hypothetical protein
MMNTPELEVIRWQRRFFGILNEFIEREYRCGIAAVPEVDAFADWIRANAEKFGRRGVMAYPLPIVDQLQIEPLVFVRNPLVDGGFPNNLRCSEPESHSKYGKAPELLGLATISSPISSAAPTSRSSPPASPSSIPSTSESGPHKIKPGDFCKPAQAERIDFAGAETTFPLYFLFKPI